MPVTTNVYARYPEFSISSANGRAQINHADASAGTFKVAVLTTASFVQAHSAYTQVSGNEIVHQNYVAGGVNLANATITVAASGTATWDADDVIITASGVALTAQAAIVYRSTVSGLLSPLMLSIDFGGTQGAGLNTTLQIQWAAAGITVFKPGA